MDEWMNGWIIPLLNSYSFSVYHAWCWEETWPEARRILWDVKHLDRFHIVFGTIGEVQPLFFKSLSSPQNWSWVHLKTVIWGSVQVNRITVHIRCGSFNYYFCDVVVIDNFFAHYFVPHFSVRLICIGWANRVKGLSQRPNSGSLTIGIDNYWYIL